MALSLSMELPVNDPRTLKILAKSMYRELRESGYAEREVVAFAGELLGLVSCEVRERRELEPIGGDLNHLLFCLQARH